MTIKRWKRTAYAAWVLRVWPQCSVLGCRTPATDPHHVNARGMGGASPDFWKDHDEANVLGLCRVHHNEAHNLGVDTFSEQYVFDYSPREAWDRWLDLPARERDWWTKYHDDPDLEF